MRPFPVAVLFTVLLWPSAGLAEEERKWISQADDAQVTLAFGTPESDDVVVVFVCDLETSEVSVNVHLETEGIEAGGEADLVLSGPGGRTELRGTGFDDEMNGIVAIKAEASSADEALKPFADQGSLSIEVPGTREMIPLSEASDAIETFRTRCPPAR